MSGNALLEDSNDGGGVGRQEKYTEENGIIDCVCKDGKSSNPSWFGK